MPAGRPSKVDQFTVFMAGYNLAMASMEKVAKAYSSLQQSSLPQEKEKVTKPLPFYTGSERHEVPFTDGVEGLGR